MNTRIEQIIEAANVEGFKLRRASELKGPGMKRKVTLEGGPFDGAEFEIDEGQTELKVLRERTAIYVVSSKDTMRFTGYEDETSEQAWLAVLGKVADEADAKAQQWQDRKMKVHVKIDGDGPFKSEWLWARRIGTDTAKVENIPCYTKAFSLGALVRFDSGRDNEVTEVIERGARSVDIIYDDSGTKEEVTQRYRALAAHLRSFDVYAEGMVAGLLVAAVPMDITAERLLEIVDASGIECQVEPEA